MPGEITVGRTSVNQHCVRTDGYYKVFRTRKEALDHAAELADTTVPLPSIPYTNPRQTPNSRRIYALAMADAARGAFSVRFRLVHQHIFDMFRGLILHRTQSTLDVVRRQGGGFSWATNQLSYVQSELEGAVAGGDRPGPDTIKLLIALATHFALPGTQQDIAGTIVPDEEELIEEEPETVEKDVVLPATPAPATTGRRRRAIRADVDCSGDAGQVE